MSGMVERVALAIRIARMPYGASAFFPANVVLAPSEPELAIARSAIMAIREPTDAMIKAAMPWSDEAGAIETWRAMIDEVLK